MTYDYTGSYVGALMGMSNGEGRSVTSLATTQYGGSGNYWGIRPVVALKSDVELQNVNGNYLIVSGEAAADIHTSYSPPAAEF